MLVTNPAERIELSHLIRHQWLSGPERVPTHIPVAFLNEKPSDLYLYNSIFDPEFDPLLID